MPTSRTEWQNATTYEEGVKEIRDGHIDSVTPIVEILPEKNDEEMREYMAYCIEKYKETDPRQSGLRWNYMYMVYEIERHLGIAENGTFPSWNDAFEEKYS